MGTCRSGTAWSSDSDVVPSESTGFGGAEQTTGWAYFPGARQSRWAESNPLAAPEWLENLPATAGQKRRRRYLRVHRQIRPSKVNLPGGSARSLRVENLSRKG